MNDIQINHAREVTLKIIDLKRKIASDFIELGKLFKDVRDNKLWEIEGAEGFNSYVAESGFDKTSVYKFIGIVEKFIDKYGVESIRLQDAGWAKLAKIEPHVDDNNYQVMLNMAENNSLSDIDKELVEQHYITKKETESQFVTCPYCHKSFMPLKRQDVIFKQEDYTKVIDVYKKVKDIQLNGKEYEPLQQAIKTMFMNGRTPDQIIKSIEWLGDNAEYEWTLNTLKSKIPEILSKIGYKPKKQMSESDLKLLKGVGLQ